MNPELTAGWGTDFSRDLDRPGLCPAFTWHFDVGQGFSLYQIGISSLIT